MGSVATFLLASVLSIFGADRDYCNRFFHDLDSVPFVLIDKQGYTLSVIDSAGHVTRSYGIGCAQNTGNKTKLGDRKTPEGQFPILRIQSGLHMKHDFGDGKGEILGAYGPWFIRLKVPDFPKIGIHGTHLPETIGSRCTEGCIRMHNDDVTDFKNRVYIGMPVVILPDSVTPAPVQQEKVYDFCVLASALSSVDTLVDRLDSAGYSGFIGKVDIFEEKANADAISRSCMLVIADSDTAHYAVRRLELVAREDTSLTILHYPSDAARINQLLEPEVKSPSSVPVRRAVYFSAIPAALAGIALLLALRRKRL